MSECGPNCDCGANSPKPVPAAPVEHRCRLVLKSGEMCEVNLSASRIKHLRRCKKPLVLMGPKRKKIMLDTKHIETIIPLNQ